MEHCNLFRALHIISMIRRWLIDSYKYVKLVFSICKVTYNRTCYAPYLTKSFIGARVNESLPFSWHALLSSQCNSCLVIWRVSGNQKLLKIPGGVLQCAIQTHCKLLKVAHLIPENCFISHQDVIPGIISAKQKDNGQWYIFLHCIFVVVFRGLCCLDSSNCCYSCCLLGLIKALW